MRRKDGDVTERERVLTALSHKEPDRVPRDLGGTESSGMTAFSLDRLMKHANASGPQKVFEPFQYVSYIPEALRRQFKVDTVNLTPEPAQWTNQQNPHGFEVLLPSRWKEETDAEGNTLAQCDQ